MGDNSDCPGGPHESCLHKSLQEGGRRAESERGSKNGSRAGGIHFKNGRRGHKPRNMGDLQKLENVRKQVLPRASFQKEHSSAHTLIFNSVRPSMDFQPPD